MLEGPALVPSPKGNLALSLRVEMTPLPVSNVGNSHWHGLDALCMAGTVLSTPTHHLSDLPQPLDEVRGLWQFRDEDTECRCD